MTRKQALEAIQAAGAQGDKQAFARLYVENRISYAAANGAWRKGARFAEFVQQRDAVKREEP